MLGFRRVFVVLLVALTLAGCVHHNPNVTPAQNAALDLYASLDVIANANQQVTRAMISLNEAGTVPTPVTRAVLEYTQQVNDASRGALAVLDSNRTPAQKATAVLDTLRKLDLPPPVQDFINSNPNAAAVISVVNTIVEIQRAINEVRATPVDLLGTAKGAN